MMWKPCSGGTFILNCADFYISYASGQNGIGFDDPAGETALVDKPADGSRGTILILNGDHRKPYSALAVRGYPACRSYYDELAPKHRSRWSEDHPMVLDQIKPEEALEILFRAFGGGAH